MLARLARCDRRGRSSQGASFPAVGAALGDETDRPAPRNVPMTRSARLPVLLSLTLAGCATEPPSAPPAVVTPLPESRYGALPLPCARAGAAWRAGGVEPVLVFEEPTASAASAHALPGP